MAWWTKANGGVFERHDTQMSAAIRLNFAHTMGGEPVSELGLYRRDPSKYPDEPNVLSETLAKLGKMNRGNRRR